MFGDSDNCAYEKDCDWEAAAQATTAFGVPTTAQNIKDVEWVTNALAHFGFGLVVRPVTFGEYTWACHNDKRLANADVMTFLLALGKGYTYELAPDPRPPALVSRNRLFAETPRQSAAVALYNLARSGVLDGLPLPETLSENKHDHRQETSARR